LGILSIASKSLNQNEGLNAHGKVIHIKHAKFKAGDLFGEGWGNNMGASATFLANQGFVKVALDNVAILHLGCTGQLLPQWGNIGCGGNIGEVNEGLSCAA
jgi:hypothetical protein